MDIETEEKMIDEICRNCKELLGDMMPCNSGRDEQCPTLIILNLM
jgi:hypothetical protein